MKYIREFVIGSSIVVLIPLYYSVYNNRPKKKYSYYHYSLIAPFWFGIWNILSLLMAMNYGLSNKERYFFISILSFITLFILQNTLLNGYDYNKGEWNNYYINIFVKYLLVWNIVIYNLDKYI